MQWGKEASLVQREVAANAAGGIDPVPGRPSAMEKADPMQWGTEASLVQREVAANAAGGIDPVPGRPSAMEKAAIQNKIPRFPGNFCSTKQRNKVRLDALGQDCNPALSGVGLPAPEQEGAQRIPTGDRNGCSVTLQKTTIGGHDEQGNRAIAL